MARSHRGVVLYASWWTSGETQAPLDQWFVVGIDDDVDAAKAKSSDGSRDIRRTLESPGEPQLTTRRARIGKETESRRRLS